MKLLKTQQERQKIAQDIKASLIDKLQLPITFKGIQEFLDVLSKYESENLSKGLNGQIVVPEISRAIDFHLPLKKRAEPVVKLVILEKVVKN